MHLQKRVGHILYEKLHFPIFVNNLFSYFLVQCILYYAKLNFKSGIFYDFFLSDEPFKTKTSFKGRKRQKYSFLNQNQCLLKQMPTQKKNWDSFELF
jgi:hypothetical protein